MADLPESEASLACVNLLETKIKEAEAHESLLLGWSDQELTLQVIKEWKALKRKEEKDADKKNSCGTCEGTGVDILEWEQCTECGAGRDVKSCR